MSKPPTVSQAGFLWAGGCAACISTLVTERQEMLLHCRKRSSTSKKANGCRRKIRGRKACEREEQWGLFLKARERPLTALLPPCGKSMRSCLWLNGGPGLPNPCPTAIYGEPAPQAQWIQECFMFCLIVRHKGWGPLLQGGAWEPGLHCSCMCLSICNRDENTKSFKLDRDSLK